MIIPEIKVVVRYIKSENHKNGFPIPCVKYGEGKYSSMFRIEDTIREEHVFTGPCPKNLRVLPSVDPKYLRGYMTYYSQRIPRGADLIVAKAVRGTCWDDIFDGEAYHPNGKIISLSSRERGHSQEVEAFINMFLKKEDYDRIDRWDEYGIENWNYDFYMEHME